MYATRPLLIFLLVLIIPLVSGSVEEFSYTGDVQEYNPQAGEYEIRVWGAQGGDAGDNQGGQGGYAEGTVNLEGTETLYVFVGEKPASTQGDNPGWPDGGYGGEEGSGGGSSSIRVGGESMSDSIIVAGAGGGAYDRSTQPGDGGDGGGTSGTSGTDYATPGTQSSGGQNDGEFGHGGFTENGVPSSTASSGGGGGYYGGGASDFGNDEYGSGAGGSGYVDSSMADTSMSTGVQSGNGFVEIELLTDPDNPNIQTPFNPSRSQASSTSDPASMSFDVDVSIDDDGGAASDNQLEECQVSVTGQDSGGSVSYNDYSPSGDSCTFSVDNDDNSNWGPGETVNVDISVEDSYGGTDTVSRTHTFSNSVPESITASVDSGDDYAGGVWGGQNGVTLEVDVTDYESASTSTNIDVGVNGDLGSIGSGVISNGQGTYTVDWERDGETAMNGFDRGESYSWDASVTDEDGLSSSDSDSFTILDEASLSGARPVGGDSGDELAVNVDNPAVGVDGGLDGFDVEFWAYDGLDRYQVGSTQSVSGETGAASVDISDFDFQNEPADGTGEWYVVVDDSYSRTDYSDSLYDQTYEFSAAEAPRILPNDTDSYPVNETGVGLNPDLSVMVDDPDDSDMNVTFYQGNPGSGRLGEVQVSGGSGLATLSSDQHSLGENPGDSFEWSVEAEDIEYDEIAESNSTYSVDVVDRPSISFVSPSAGESRVSVDPVLEAEVEQNDNEDLQVNYSVKGGGLNLTHQEVASGTASGSDVSQGFELEEGTQYDWRVNASFTDENDNDVNVSDSISFNTAEAPDLQDFSPGNGESGLENPELSVDFDNPGSVGVEFYDWESDGILDGNSGVTGSYSFNSSNADSFGGQAGENYFWYTVIEDESTGATYNSSEDEGPWEFSTSEVLDADIDVLRGDQNLNPGSADVGSSSIEVRVSNSQDLAMDEAEFYVDGSMVEALNEVPEDETISFDISDTVSSEDSEFDWSMKVFQDSNEIGSYSGTFTTHVASLEWTDESSSDVPAEFNVYHSNEESSFNYGDGDYEIIGQGLRQESVTVAPQDLGYGSNDCFRATAENSAGESSDASPPLGSEGECIGGEIP